MIRYRAYEILDGNWLWFRGVTIDFILEQGVWILLLLDVIVCMPGCCFENGRTNGLIFILNGIQSDQSHHSK